MVEYRKSEMRIFKELFYKFSCLVLYGFFRLFFRLSVRGRQNIPPDRNFILIARHKSYWDVPLLAAALGKNNRIYFVARETLIGENFIIGNLVKWFAIPIDREKFRPSDFKIILRSLREGKILGIFPEGTTLATDRIHRGVLLFAQKAKKELLPVNIASRGTYPPRNPLRLPRITVHIGPPFGVEDLRNQTKEGEFDQEKNYEQMGRQMMERIDLLEEEQIGENCGKYENMK